MSVAAAHHVGVKRRVQGRHIGRYQVVALSRDAARRVFLGVESAHYFEIMPAVEGLGIVRIYIGRIVVLPIRVLLHAALSGGIASTAHVPSHFHWVAVHVPIIDRQYFPMLVLGIGADVPLQVDVPILDRLEHDGQLVGIDVRLASLPSAVFHLLDFAFVHRIAVGVIGRLDGPLTGNVVEEEARQIRGTFIILARPFGRVGQLHPIGQLRRNLAVERVALEVVAPVPAQSVLVQEVAAEDVLNLVASAADADVVLVRGRPTFIELLDPVHIVVGAFVPLGPGIAAGHGGMFQLAVHVVLDVLHVRVVKDGRPAIVGVGQVEHRGEVVGIGHVRHANRVVEADVARIVDARFAALPVFGRDEDNAKGCTRAVDGSRRGVFQHRHVLDVIGVQRVHVALHAVYQDQGRRAGAFANRACSTDIDIHLRVQRSAGIADRQVQAGDLALQRLRHVLHGTRLEYFRLYHRHGSRHVHLLLHAVAHNDHFVQQGHVFLQHDVQRDAFPTDFHGFIADVRDLQGAAFGHAFQFELAVQVRYGADAHSLYPDRSSDDTFSCGIFHHALARARLQHASDACPFHIRQGMSRAHAQCRTEQQGPDRFE